MTDAHTATQFSEQATLRNGTPVLIRVALPQDRDKVVAAFGKLEANSIYTRFFSARKELSAAELDRFSGSDFFNTVSLVALVGNEPDEEMIGGASYVALPTAGREVAAEVAFTIEEDCQGQGLAGKLLALLMRIARQHGISFFEADVLVGNTPMLKVFERTGLPIEKSTEGGVIHLVIDLRKSGA